MWHPWGANHVYIRERLGARFFISKMRAENRVVWKVLLRHFNLLVMIIRMTPKTRRKTEFYRLLSYRQSFVKSIGVFPAGQGTSFKIRPVLRELIRFLGFCQLFWANPSNDNLATKTIRQTQKKIRQTVHMFVRLSLLLLTVCRIVFGVCRIFFHQCLPDCPVCRIFLHENPANWPKLHTPSVKHF